MSGLQSMTCSTANLQTDTEQTYWTSQLIQKQAWQLNIIYIVFFILMFLQRKRKLCLHNITGWL